MCDSTFCRGDLLSIPTSLSDFSEWVTLAKISFENRANVKSVFKTFRHEELEQILSDIIRNRYNATDKGNS
ncbi:MAG: hypothetical protein J6O04_00100 [Selenomonadaceae bacterium]|nr:hypothetical protein [Selenomonadaceae bacterium]